MHVHHVSLTFAHNPDAAVDGEMSEERDDPRMNDELGPEGGVDDEHVAGPLPHLAPYQPHAVVEIQVGIIPLGMPIHGPQLIRRLSQLVASHATQIPLVPLVKTADDDSSRAASNERLLHARRFEPLQWCPGRLHSFHLPLPRDQFRKFRVAAHAQVQIGPAGVRSYHPESFRFLVVADDEVVHVDVVLFVSEDRAFVVKVVLLQVDPVHFHQLQQRLVEATDKHPSVGAGIS